MKKTKICAFLCALAVGVSLTGCADTTWALKDGSVTIPTGVYTYYLLSNASTVASQNSTSSGSDSDIWSTKIDGTTADTWAMNQALESTKELAVVEKLSAQRKITLASGNKTDAANTASSNYSSNSTLFSKNGISQTSLERVMDDMYLEQSLFNSYYGPSGDKAVPESQVSDYYSKNFVHVRQIFVAKIDTSTNEPLSSDKLAAAKKKADEAYAKVKADPANFDSYVKTYNEDTGETADGYIFSKQSAADQNFDQKFVDLAFSLKDGQVGEAESDMGYFIEYKLPTDPNASSFDSNMKSTALFELKDPDFESMLKSQVQKDNIQVNQSALNHYAPKNLDLSGS